MAVRDFPQAIVSVGSRIRHEIIANRIQRSSICGFLAADDFSMHSLPFHRLSKLASNYFPLRTSGIDSCVLSTVTPREKRVEHERKTSSYRAAVKCVPLSRATSFSKL